VAFHFFLGSPLLSHKVSRVKSHLKRRVLNRSTSALPKQFVSYAKFLELFAFKSLIARENMKLKSETFSISHMFWVSYGFNEVCVCVEVLLIHHHHLTLHHRDRKWHA